MGTKRPSSDDPGVGSATEFMYQIVAGNTEAKLRLLLKASDGVPKDTIEEMSEIRSDHIDTLKEQKYIYEADGKYKITPPRKPKMEQIERLLEKCKEESNDPREELLEFMYNTDWDADLREDYDIFTEAKIITRDPMSKFSTLIQTASAIKSVRQTISLPGEIQYRLHDAQDLSPDQVEFIYTHTAMTEVITDDGLHATAKENDRSGVQYKFLDQEAATPAYNLTLLNVDQDLLQDLRAPTGWVSELDLTDWVVGIEVLASTSRSKQLLIADTEAVRDWALNHETGIYYKYKRLASEDSWTDPKHDGPILEYLKV